MSAERRTLQEQVGKAFNSSALRIEGRSPGAESSLQQVAALGAAALHVQHGVDRGRGLASIVATAIANPAHQPDPQDVLVAELAALLWHIRYGAQHDFVPRAATQFAIWLAYRGRFGFLPAAERAGLLHKLAVRALHEWLSDRCIACGGSGKEERSRTGAWIRPRGSMQRNATFRTCKACAGTRRQPVSHAQRAQALGLTRQRYDDERWDAHCGAAISWLGKQIAPRLKRPLTVQLERGTKRV